MKARSKRLVALFATLAMTVSLLAGCGGGSSEPASSDSSEFLGWWLSPWEL